MSLILVTGPTLEPITMAEVKRHLRLDTTDGERAPLAPTAALASPAAPGNVDDGAHRYGLTFVTADGETELGAVTAAVTVADKTVNGKVELTAIPLGGAQVTDRTLYRTEAGGTSYKLLATLADNTTEVYTDNIADSALGAEAPSTNTTADPELLGFITAARQYAELATWRALIEQTWDLVLDRFPPDGCPIWVPKAPLQSVTSVTYLDAQGASQTWDSDDYDVDVPVGPHAQRGRIVPAYNEVYPVTRTVINAVTVRFVAGYGDAVADVPQMLKVAMLWLIDRMYETRSDEIEEGEVSRADRIFWSFRAV